MGGSGLGGVGEASPLPHLPNSHCPTKLCAQADPALAAAAGTPRPDPAAHDYTFAVEPLTAVAVAGAKPMQVVHAVGPTDVFETRLWAPPGSPAPWLPTHWARVAYAVDSPPLRGGLDLVQGMRLGMAYVVPAIFIAVLAVAVANLFLTERARETRAALRTLRAPRAPPPRMGREELAMLQAAMLEGAGGEGAGGSGGA